MKTQSVSINQVSFHLLSKKTFSDEKYLNAWSLKGNRLNLQEWLDFKKVNENNFYNKHLENTLKAMQEFKTCFSIDQFEGINLSTDDEWLDFLPQNYTQIYNRLCRDKSKYFLHRYYQDELTLMGFIENLSPNLPFWNEMGENFPQDKIDTFIENDLLEPRFSQYDVYFNSSLNLTFNFNEENLNYLIKNYDYRIKKSFIPINGKSLEDELNLNKEIKIALELEYMFLNLCKGISADYAFMDFSYFFVAYDYILNSKNNPFKSYPLKMNDLFYERSFKKYIQKYANNYYLNYYSNEILEDLNTQNLMNDRYNRYIINYDKLPKNSEEEDIQGLLSRQKDLKINFLNFINYQDYVYNNKDDFWEFTENENALLWEKFLAKDTIKPFPINFDCSLEEKELYSHPKELQNVLKAHRLING
ncbi:hypothetical protein [Campylobacter aviculae]|uniref:Uncharacterized protein n=1 Tax=Campylobacter aviculae TaxID=2510190 RepID=A0A4U7BEN5_9BACT|nr:hypothetical protein [Campylobacter aviculae]TKX28471.1 hypothetical protein CQA76_08730 [Campylobacter aviculae]